MTNETRAKHAWLDDQAFYETCQAYRHAGIVHQDVVVERFEQLKDFIREQSDEEHESLRQQNAELVRALKKSVERIEQLCTTANNLSNMLKLGDKVRAEHFTDHARAILATVQS